MQEKVLCVLVHEKDVPVISCVKHTRVLIFSMCGYLVKYVYALLLNKRIDRGKRRVMYHHSRVFILTALQQTPPKKTGTSYVLTMC